MGEIETWNKAEKQLEEALNEFGQKWAINPGDGAFYGPKVDIFLFKEKKQKINLNPLFRLISPSKMH